MEGKLECPTPFAVHADFAGLGRRIVDERTEYSLVEFTGLMVVYSLFIYVFIYLNCICVGGSNVLCPPLGFHDK